MVLKHPCSKTCSGYTQAREETIADFERMIESTANNESLAFNTDEIQGRDILRKELLNKIKQLKG